MPCAAGKSRVVEPRHAGPGRPPSVALPEPRDDQARDKRHGCLAPGADSRHVSARFCGIRKLFDPTGARWHLGTSP